jgi:UDP-2-acetamido-2-deoxy-ribo-hexuluronate aminotransferase
MDTADRPRSIAFIDLAAQQARIRQGLDKAIARVLDHGCYIMGPEVVELETALAAFCGAKHAITCASGTDALVLALMAKGLRPGDAVIVPSYTFCATAEAVCLLGSIPVFVDVDEDTFNLDAINLMAGIDTARRLGLRLRGVITVDLYGQPCDYDAIEPIVREQNIFLVCDAAQAFGARYRGRSVGTFGDVTATSFFPAKPLGCYGDGGAAFTDDDETAAAMRSLRVHGQGRDKYDNVRIGLNARIDTLQAAVLLQKLEIFPEEIVLRQRVAEGYSSGLAGTVRVPVVGDDRVSVWAQYTVRAAGRDRLINLLKANGVPTAVYYGRPLHQQRAYRRYPVAGGALAVTERVASEVLSLPMHAWLQEADQGHILCSLTRIG